jgi:hypothetical protein
MSETTQVTTPIDFKALMAKAADAAKAQEKPDNKWISFKSGMLAFNGNVAPGNKLKCVVISSAHENQFFPNAYDPDKLVSPNCYAIAHDPDHLEPVLDEVTHAESDSCSRCPKNEWVENAKGKSMKECKNVRRIALITEDQIPNGLSAEVLYAKLPVMSVQNWAKFVTQISSVVKRPSWGVVCEMSVVPDVKSQFRVQFQFVSLVPDEYLEGMLGLHELTQKDILFGYPKNKDEEEFETPKPAAKKPKM